MGKAADNERVKLVATAYNNFYVGLMLGGVLIPYLALVQRGVEINRSVVAVLNGSQTVTTNDLQTILVTLLAFVLAMSGGLLCRRWRNQAIAMLKD